jgi:hypothetical protein
MTVQKPHRRASTGSALSAPIPEDVDVGDDDVGHGGRGGAWASLDDRIAVGKSGEGRLASRRTSLAGSRRASIAEPPAEFTLDGRLSASQRTSVAGSRRMSLNTDSTERGATSFGEQLAQAKTDVRTRLDQAAEEAIKLLEDASSVDVAAVRRVFDALGMSMSTLLGEFSDAHQSVSRVQLKEHAAAMEVKLTHQRRSSAVSLQHQATELEGVIEKKVNARVREMVAKMDGGEELAAAHNKIAQLTSDNASLEKELRTARGLLGESDDEVARLREQVEQITTSVERALADLQVRTTAKRPREERQ